MEPCRTIGQRIAKCRKLRGLTQAELGMKVGFTSTNASIRIVQYENGTRIPKIDIVIKIANALDVDVFQFVYLSDNANNAILDLLWQELISYGTTNSVGQRLFSQFIFKHDIVDYIVHEGDLTLMIEMTEPPEEVFLNRLIENRTKFIKKEIDFDQYSLQFINTKGNHKYITN